MSTRTLWISPTDWVTGDTTLRLSYPSAAHPATEITTTTPGDLKWVFASLRLPAGILIKAVQVCYQLSNSRSFISQIRLEEMQTPDQAVVRHDDPTDLLSTAPTCYISQVGAYRPAGAVTLALRLKFTNANQNHKITLGSVGVEVEDCEIEVANVKCFGAVGDGVTDDTAAIQAALDSGAKEVFAPAGTYIHTLLELNEGQTLRGEGGTIFKLANNTIRERVCLGITAKSGLNSVTLRDFEYDGNVLGNPWNGLCRDDIHHHGINFSRCGDGRISPKHAEVHNIYAHDCVRNPFLFAGESFNASNLRARNSAIDHLFYVQAERTGNLVNAVCEGYWRGAAIVSQGQQFTNIVFRNLAKNPNEGMDATRFITDRFSPKFFQHGSQFINLTAEFPKEGKEGDVLTPLNRFLDFRGPGTHLNGLNLRLTDKTPDSFHVLRAIGNDPEGGVFKNISIQGAPTGLVILSVDGILRDTIIEAVTVRFNPGVTAGNTPLVDINAKTTGLTVRDVSANEGCGRVFNISADCSDILFENVRVKNNPSIRTHQIRESVATHNITVRGGTANEPGAGALGSKIHFENFFFNDKPTAARGSSTHSGNGAATTFSVAHGLPQAPKVYGAVAKSDDARALFKVTADATHVHVSFAAAPPTGSNNVEFNWWADISNV